MKAWKAVAGLLVVQAAIAGAYWITSGESSKPVPTGKPTRVPEGEQWVDLLDAEHAPLWKNVSDEADIFEIVDGMLHIYGVTVSPLRYVGYTGEMLGNFDLHIEYMLTPRANSGIFIRKQPDDDVMRGFEIQVLDDFGDAPTRNTSGAIYDVVTPMFNLSRPAGEWNSFDIAVREQQVIVYHNGWMILYTDIGLMDTPLGKFEYAFKDLPLTGMLALQDHGGEAWYRNIRVQHFKKEAAPASAPATLEAPAAPAEPTPEVVDGPQP